MSTWSSRSSTRRTSPSVSSFDPDGVRQPSRWPGKARRSAAHELPHRSAQASPESTSTTTPRTANHLKRLIGRRGRGRSRSISSCAGAGPGRPVPRRAPGLRASVKSCRRREDRALYDFTGRRPARSGSRHGRDRSDYKLRKTDRIIEHRSIKNVPDRDDVLRAPLRPTNWLELQRLRHRRRHRQRAATAPR